MISVDGPDDQVGVHAGHDVGVARLADRDDAAVTNADVGLDDSPVVDDHRAGDDGVGCTVGAGGAALPHRLAQHLAAAEHRLVACQSRAAAAVLGDLDEQVGVGQPDAVAGGGPEQCGVAGPRQLGHGASNRPGGLQAQPVHLAGSAQRNQRNTLGDTGFEAHRGAGRDVEPVTVGGIPVELQRGVGLRQMHVAADLHRAVAGVDDVHLESLARRD